MGSIYALWLAGAVVVSHPVWTAYGGQTDARFGTSVAGAGDVNADGYADVIVGAWRYSATRTAEGAAFLFLGNAQGLSPVPAWSAVGGQDLAFFGVSVAGAGDVNGDGYDDVVVGAHGYDNGESDEGAVFLFHGKPDGLTADPVWRGEPDVKYASLGISVASAGDVNGDGFADVIAGAHTHDGTYQIEGRAFVWLGPDLQLAWSAGVEKELARYGASVGSAGDVDADGYDDVIVGAWSYDGDLIGEGLVEVFAGGPDGPSKDPVWSVRGGQQQSQLGASVAGAGDINGDGYDDVITGAWSFNTETLDVGALYVFLGSAGGLEKLPAQVELGGDIEHALFGASVSPAGDINHDGYADVIAGAPEYNGGRIRLFLGSADGLLETWSLEEEQADARFGFPVTSAGDVNGDGAPDLIAGAFAYDYTHTDEGRATVYLGLAPPGSPSDCACRLSRPVRPPSPSGPILLLVVTAVTGIRRRVD